MVGRSIPEEKIIQIYEFYFGNPGCTCKDIAYIVRHKCVMTIYNRLKAAGYECYNSRGSPPLTPGQKRKLDKARKDGCSLRKAAIRGHTTYNTVLKYWNSQGWETNYLPGGRYTLRPEKRKSLEDKLR